MATAADEDAGAPDPVGPLEPVTCSELSRTVMSGQCQTQSRCGANQLLTSCSLTGTDFWSCNCSDAETSLGFVLSGVDEQSACDVTADLCLHGTGPLESDAPECTPGDGSDPQYACQTTTTCTQTTQLSAGVSALTTDQLVAQCVDLGAGSYQCSCLNDAGGYSYVTHDVDAATACQSGMLLCDPYTPPTLPEPGDCEPTLEQRSGDECEWRHECVHTLALSNGVTIDVSELKYASCTTGPEGNLGCTCSDADRNLSFGLSSGEVGLPACEQAASLCETPSASKATDVVTCAPYTITSGADACTVRTQCSQPAIQNEVPIQLYGSLTAYCVTGTEALAEGQWNCSCDFSGVSQSMQLEVADAESGCRMAADACNGVDLAGPLSIIDSSSAVAR
jgi:hypothetical protein